jgi:hypothetical protein
MVDISHLLPAWRFARAVAAAIRENTYNLS